MRLSYRPNSHHSYTKLVRRLRVILPLAAVAVLGVVILWPRFDPLQAPKRHIAAAPPAMTHSHFSGMDKHDRPFTVTANKIVQKSLDSKDIDLTQPLAEMTMQKGSWVALKADHGTYEENPGMIKLQGDVRLFHDDGYEMVTSVAAIDLDEGIAWSDQPTQSHGPRGSIDAQGFRMVQDGEKIIFTGPGRLVLRPESGEEEAPGQAVTP